MADASQDPHFQDIKVSNDRLSQAEQAAFDKLRTSRRLHAEQPQFQQSEEAREAFPVSRQASTRSGASVGEMNPRYPKEARLTKELKPAGSRRIR